MYMFSMSLGTRVQTQEYPSKLPSILPRSNLYVLKCLEVCSTIYTLCMGIPLNLIFVEKIPSQCGMPICCEDMHQCIALLGVLDFFLTCCLCPLVTNVRRTLFVSLDLWVACICVSAM